MKKQAIQKLIYVVACILACTVCMFLFFHFLNEAGMKAGDRYWFTNLPLGSVISGALAVASLFSLSFTKTIGEPE